MVSPPKPWERAGATAAVAGLSSSPQQQQQQQDAPSALTVASSTVAPSVPERPPSLSSNAAGMTSQYANPLTSQYNTSPYSSPYSSYASPYNRMGAYGGGYGMGGYGGIGSSYGMGGYGGIGGYGTMGYGGMGMGMGMGMQPPGFDPNNSSLTQQLEATTHSTFALIQSIVQTFGGFAQMLESTFMATHSSFFAMVGVADQLGQLRNALGSVLGLFGALRWLKSVISGRPNDGGLTDEFGNFLNRPPGVPPPNPNAPKPSKKPLIFFFLAIFGIPYLMHKLIRHLAARLPPPNGSAPPIDPSKLVFARATYPFDTKDPVELALREGEIVAVLGTMDPVTGVEGEWWRGRTREGREGWFPKAYVEVLSNIGSQEPKKVV